MNKKIITITILLVICLNSFSQADSSKISYVAYWEAGDVYEFKITKLKKQWKGENQIKSDSSTYIARFEVLESTDNLYRIKWTYQLDLTPAMDLPESWNQVLTKHSLSELIYTTNELGEFIEIENWQQVADLVKELFKEVIKEQAKNDNKTHEALEVMMTPFISHFTSKEGIQQALFKELQCFHFPLGYDYPINDTIKYENELPFMEGAVIKTDASIFFESVDFENDYSVMIHQSIANPEDTKTAIIGLFKEMGINNNDLEEMVKSFNLEFYDDNRYEYYFFPGIPSYIETTRIVRITNLKEIQLNIEKIIIELI